MILSLINKYDFLTLSDPRYEMPVNVVMSSSPNQLSGPTGVEAGTLKV